MVSDDTNRIKLLLRSKEGQFRFRANKDWQGECRSRRNAAADKLARIRGRPPFDFCELFTIHSESDCGTRIWIRLPRISARDNEQGCAHHPPPTLAPCPCRFNEAQRLCCRVLAFVLSLSCLSAPFRGIISGRRDAKSSLALGTRAVEITS